MNYWRFGDYIGIGAGAHGKATIDGAIWRTARNSQPRRYLSDSTGTARKVPASELAAEFMMNALRLVDGVDEATFSARTGLPLAKIAATVRELADWGLFRSDHIGLTERGYRQLDSVVARFL